MVQQLAEIAPRTSGDTIVPNPDNDDGDFFRPQQLRDVFIFQNDLDTYAEVTLLSTHSQDPDFSNALVTEEGVALRPGTTREVAYTDSNERIRLIVRTPTAPTSGTFTIWKERDHTPLRLTSERLNQFKELNEGRTYAVDFQESLAAGDTITAGVRNPPDAETNVYVRQFGLSVGGDGLATTEIDHDSYTDGTSVPVLNTKPELQIERPLNASVTKNPTISSPQAEMTAFLPGGTAGNTAVGNRFNQADYELSPGQDLTLTLQNDSGSSNRFGFALTLIETVVR